MPTVGIVGGLGPESTIDYYRQIIEVYRQRTNGANPHILINSLDIARGLHLSTNNLLPELTDFLVEGVEPLARAGADFAVMAANTAHLVFDEVAARSPIPLLSIVEATLDAARAAGLRRVSLLGTRMTMQADFYPRTFARHDIAVVAPAPEDREWIHQRYINELLVGKFLPETRAGLFSVIDKLRVRQRVDGILLAGTELPLILRTDSHLGLPLLDTTKIHVEAIVGRLLAS